MPSVKTWVKAFVIACLVELLFVVGLLGMRLANSTKLYQGVLNCLSLYHMFAMSLAFTVLHIIWDWPGPGRQPISTPTILTYFLVYLFQLMLTTPIMYGVLRWIGFVGRKKAKGRP